MAGRLDAGGEPARVAHGRPGARAAGRGRARRLPRTPRSRPASRRRCCAARLAGAYQIMYVAPERLADPRFLEFARRGGHRRSSPWTRRTAFRNGARTSARRTWPSATSSRQLPTRPAVAAFTATATERVRRRHRAPSGSSRPLRGGHRVRPPEPATSAWSGWNPSARSRASPAYALAHPGGIAASCTAPPARTPTRCTRRSSPPGVRATRYHARHVGRRPRGKASGRSSTHDAPGHGGHERLRHGHRQVERALRRPSQHARDPWRHTIRRPGRAGRDGEPSDVPAVLERRRRVHLPFLHRAGVGQRGAHAQGGRCRARLAPPACWRPWCGYCHTTGCLRRYILRLLRRPAGSAGLPAGGQAGAAEVSGTESCGSKPSSRPEGRYVGLSPQSRHQKPPR